MKKIMLLVVICMQVIQSDACDACGGNITGDGWGLMPNNNRHFIGLRFQYRQYHNQHPTDDISSLTGFENATDNFYRTDLYGRYSITRRLQLQATLPYRYNRRIESEGTMLKSGIGDASLAVNFFPVVPGMNDWKHAFQINAGVEAPTGKFSFSHDIPSNMQTGSGSWDYVAGLSYVLRYKNVGMSVEGIQRFNGHTGAGYDWGNSSSYAGKFFVSIASDSVTTWMPWSGVSGEYFETNIENMKYQIKAAYTGGNALSWNAGIDFYNPSIGFGMELGLPIINELAEGYSSMKVSVGGRLMIFIQNKKDLNKSKKTND